MALSKATAIAINDIVKSDEGCREAIDSVLAFFLPDGMQIAGALRNFSMVFVDIPNYLIEDAVNLYRRKTAGPGKPFERFEAPKNFSNKSPAVERYICVGIAEATVKVINRKLMMRPALKNLVDKAEFADRATGIAHAATRLKMKDGSNYIFDWHMTLNIDNPCVFRDKNWNNRVGGITLQRFSGFP